MSTIEELAAQAAATQDQTVDNGGSGDYTPPVEGRTVARFIEYIELGKHGQKPYQGKAKPDVEEVRLTFELLHPKKNLKEIETDTGKKTIAERVSIRMAIKLGDKARYKKLFTKMMYGRDGIKHMAQMLGEAFVVTIVHNKSEDGKRTYVNIENDIEGWLIQPPRMEDPLSGEVKTIPVIPAISPLKIFLWQNPTKETWDSLFIDGTREVTENNVKKQVSKNWLQELILSATDYSGSALEAMLNKLGNLSIAKEEPAELRKAADEALDALESQKPKETTVDEDLASLGLN
jgi:hypothetical protein